MNPYERTIEALVHEPTAKPEIGDYKVIRYKSVTLGSDSNLRVDFQSVYHEIKIV